MNQGSLIQTYFVCNLSRSVLLEIAPNRIQCYPNQSIPLPAFSMPTPPPPPLPLPPLPLLPKHESCRNAYVLHNNVLRFMATFMPVSDLPAIPWHGAPGGALMLVHHRELCRRLDRVFFLVPQRDFLSTTTHERSARRLTIWAFDSLSQQYLDALFEPKNVYKSTNGPCHLNTGYKIYTTWSRLARATMGTSASSDCTDEKCAKIIMFSRVQALQFFCAAL
jgi:hypothetical protein